MKCLITLINGEFWFYTKSKKWSQVETDANGWTWKEIKEFRSKFRKAGTVTLLCEHPFEKARGIGNTDPVRDLPTKLLPKPRKVGS